DRLQRNEVLRLQEEFLLHAGGVSVLDHYWSSTEATLGPHWTPTGPVSHQLKHLLQFPALRPRIEL
ncbi:hypothetical protein KIN20_014725, partial [Parelaphostrongylus tenuis]